MSGRLGLLPTDSLSGQQNADSASSSLHAWTADTHDNNDDYMSVDDLDGVPAEEAGFFFNNFAYDYYDQSLVDGDVTGWIILEYRLA